MSIKSFVLYAAGFSLLAAYLLYTPVPEGVEDPTVLRFASPIFSLTYYLSVLTWYLGFDAETVFSISKTLNKLKSSSSYDTNKMELITELWDGIEVLKHIPVKKSKTKSAAIVFIHGGGYVLSEPKAYQVMTSHLTSELDIPVFSINYRKAPKHTYPIPLNDCVKAVEYMFRNADKLGIDAQNVAFVGDSAGAQLATAVSMKLLLNKSPFRPKALGLIYPATQHLTSNTPSMIKNRNDLLLKKTVMSAFILAYVTGDLKDVLKFNKNAHASLQTRAEYANKFNLPKLSNKGEADSDGPVDVEMVNKYSHTYTDPMLSPLFSDKEVLAKLPPTLIQVCTFDILRDDGEMFAQRIEEAGGFAELKEYSTIHGAFSLFPHYPPATKIMTDLILFLKSKLNVA